MITFSVSWAIFLLVFFIVKFTIRKDYKAVSDYFYIIISTIFVIAGTVLDIIGTQNIYYLFPFIYIGIYAFLHRDDPSFQKGFSFIVLLTVSIISLINLFLNLPYISYLVPFSAVFLLFRKYRDNYRLIWIPIIISIIVGFFFSKEIFYLLNALIPISLIYEILSELGTYVEKSKNIYKNIVDRAIKAELDKQHSDLNNELSIAYRRLREIFKLSNKTIEPIKVEEILENVGKGLTGLGYTGVVTAVTYKDLLLYNKTGFFPGFRRFLEKDIYEINEMEISKDETKVYIPLYTDRGKIGVLGVYKKTPISPNEIEYLRTYANSVAISIAKTLYFKEIGYLENILSKMFETLDIGIAVLNKDLKVETANKAFEKIFNKNLNGILFDSNPSLKEIKDKLLKVIEEDKPFEVTKEINKRIYRIKAVRLSLEEEKIVLLMEDITEFVQLERQLLETEKHIALGRIVAGLSHDVKNPLSSILAYAYTLKKRIKDEKIIDIVEKIEKKANVATKITQRLINYVNPNYEDEKVVNIKDIILESVEFSIPTSAKKRIDLELDLEDGLIFCDPMSLQRVFTNIFMNAVDAIKDKGKISVKVYKDNKYIYIHIKDTGTGIPENIKDKIFEPFFTTKKEGTGLGLVISQKIIKDYGGSIDFISEEGKGTEFIIKFPLYRDEEKNGGK